MARYIYRQDQDVSGGEFDFAVLRVLLTGDSAIVTAGTTLIASGITTSVFRLNAGTRLDVYGHLFSDWNTVMGPLTGIDPGGSGSTAAITVNIGAGGVIQGQTAIGGMGRVILSNLGEIAGGVVLSGGDASSLTNGGTITGGITALDGDGVSIINDGRLYGNIAVYTRGADNQILNSGTIISSGTAIWFSQSGAAANSVVNTGSIVGGADAAAIQGSAYADSIRNSGLISGDIALGSGGDRYDGTLGRIDGRVFGGDGADTLIGSADHAARLFGEIGADALVGGDSNDWLIGGRGADVLTGGGGRDRFVYESILDAPAQGRADRITDFEKGDRIDLSRIDANTTNGAADDAFDFGIAAGRAGSISFRYDATSDTTSVFLYIDNNRRVDGLITLTGSHELTPADFIL
jgi:Ca2+-binding RTX toxin-like protein